MHSCEECGLKLGSINGLKSHIVTDHQGVRHKCNFCEKSFTRNWYLQEHMKSHDLNDPKEMFPCNICDKQFESKPGRLRHVEKVHKKIRYTCPLCKAIFRTKSNLDTHIQRRHTGERPHKCDQCSKSYVTKRELLLHKTRHLGEAGKTFQCSQCDKKYFEASTLRFHMKTHQSGKTHHCTQCAKKFRSTSHLKRHSLTHSNVKPHNCSKCPASFHTTAQLQSHAVIHQNERPHNCSVCDAKFKTKSRLRGHFQRIHCPDEFKEKTFMCVFCPKSFREKGNLYAHIRTHIQEYSEVCNYCGKLFMTSSNLKQHVTKHHLNLTLTRPKCNFRCNICNKHLLTAYTLEIHMRKHTKETPFKCEKCNRKFTSEYGMNRHESACALKEPYSCPNCEWSTWHKREYNAHVKQHFETKYKCSQCGKLFGSKMLWRQHFERMHQTSPESRPRPHSCEICQKCYYTKRDLRTHMRLHSTHKPFECNLYEFSSKIAYNVQLHIKRIHTNEKPYKCDVCLKPFKTMMELKQHVTCHNNEKHLCNECGNFYSSKLNLKSHMKRVHSKAKLRYSCEVCKKQFYNQPEKYRHQNLHLQRTHACLFCNNRKFFHTEFQLLKHTCKHTKENLYLCSICGWEFSVKGNLKRHLVSVHEMTVIDKTPI